MCDVHNKLLRGWKMLRLRFLMVHYFYYHLYQTVNVLIINVTYALNANLMTIFV